MIPNSELYTSALTVNTAYKQRRLQVAVGIGYEDDIETAKAEILQALDKVESVSKKATPSVIATGFGGSSMDLTVRWFIDNGTQANKVASIHQVIVEVKKALDAADINIPFPIRTIDLSDPSVKSIVQQINKQQDEDVNDDNAKKAETE